jgi:hypothetical protein
LVESERVGHLVVLEIRFNSVSIVFLNESISSIPDFIITISSARCSYADRIRREVGRDIHVNVVESNRQIFRSGAVWNSEWRGSICVRNRNKRAIPSSSSDGADSWSSKCDSCVVWFVVIVKDNPEVSRSRSIANNIVDEISSISRSIILIAVVLISRRSSVTSSKDSVVVRGRVKSQFEVSSLNRDGNFVDGVIILIRRYIE